jgi:flagellar assembly factor FliW
LDGDLTDNSNIATLVIATVPDDFKDTTVNMKAPVVINKTRRLAAQVILPDYEFRRRLYTDEGAGQNSGESPELEEAGGA